MALGFGAGRDQDELRLGHPRHGFLCQAKLRRINEVISRIDPKDRNGNRLQLGVWVVITRAFQLINLVIGIAIACARGATVITTTRNPANTAALLAAGAHHVLTTGADPIALTRQQIAAFQSGDPYGASPA